MLKATRPFVNKVPGYSLEPSLRIGKKVPKNAVNLAYYFNPTAMDEEKVLTAEAPRNTIDHIVEDDYRYLFDQASNDDNLFPGYIDYKDDEGYQGRLGRMYVNWYPEAHIETKNITRQQTIVGLSDKTDVPKSITYEKDVDGYSGTLYFDAASYTVSGYETLTSKEPLEYTINNFEVGYHKVFDSYIDQTEIDEWMIVSGEENSRWPSKIIVEKDRLIASDDGDQDIVNYINSLSNIYDGATGVLDFVKNEYEPMGSIGSIPTITTQGTKVFKFITEKQTEMPSMDSLQRKFKDTYRTTGSGASTNVSKIETFLEIARQYGYETTNKKYKKIANCITEKNKSKYEVFLYRSGLSQEGSPDTGYYAIAEYSYTIVKKGTNGSRCYDVLGCYGGILSKVNSTTIQIPNRWDAVCNYTGIIRKIWYDYDGLAYYRGSVVKGNAIGNVNPENGNELLMFPDDDGYLRTEDGIYSVESEQVYITDVFKDNIACFYKYQLQQSIFDYRGPDDNGYYDGNAIQVFQSNLKNLSKDKKYRIKLDVAEWEDVTIIGANNVQTIKKIPKRYNAYVYSSFISSATDTCKIVYNAYNGNKNDNVAIENGVVEEMYNYPYFVKNVDYTFVPIDTDCRTNKIHLTNPNIITDTRRYVSFSYMITAERKSDGKIFSSDVRTASILNKEFAVESEHNKFEDRAMIISPIKDGLYMSPFDVILNDQSIRGTETVITSKDTDFIFYATILQIANEYRGAVNIKCNPDGSGNITAETTIDTGFYNNATGKYNLKLSINNKYLVSGGKIYMGYKVKCIDARSISVTPPREDGLLDSWYPLLKFGHYSQVMEQYGSKTKVCYSMPEYDLQHFSQIYGKPYIDVKEEVAEVLNSHMIKTKCFPLFLYKTNDIYPNVFDTIRVMRCNSEDRFTLTVTNVSFSDGIIFIKEALSENDTILVDYTYLEENYVYRGFWREKNDFCRIDLNPNQYHSYSDLTYAPSKDSCTTNLFNKVIYFFMRPTFIGEGKEIIDNGITSIQWTQKIKNQNTLYHKIDDDKPESEYDIYIGSVYIKQNTSLQSTILIDSRSRGGGIIESMKDSLRSQLEPESDWYLDIGFYDGKPYQESGVIVVRLDNRLLKEFGGRFTQVDIETKVKRWLGYGVYPIIEYVNSYLKQDLPQYTLTVEDSYTNVVDETLDLSIDCIQN